MDRFDCLKCECSIFIPNIDDKDKRELILIKQNESDFLLIQKINKLTHLNLKDSKALAYHINNKVGFCHRCNYKDLVSENVICPKCKSFNTNWDDKI